MKRLSTQILLLCVTLTGFAQTPAVTLPAKEAGITGGAQYYADGDFIVQGFNS